MSLINHSNSLEQIIHPVKTRKIIKHSQNSHHQHQHHHQHHQHHHHHHHHHHHRSTLEVALIQIHRVVLGRFELIPWYPSPYLFDPQEYRIATSSHPKQQQQQQQQQLKQQQHQNQNQNHQQNDRSQTPDDSLSSLDSISPSVDLAFIHPSYSSIPPPPPSSCPHTPIPHSIPTPSSSSSSSSSSSPPLKLYVCDGCLKYSLSLDSFRQHKIHCKMTHPPGRKVYQSGKLIIREIDGSKAKLYCQCLCLFAKLFIDHKYIFFDVDGFKFYVLTIQEDHQLHPPHPSGTQPGLIKQQKIESIMGFFSKEKISYDGYNLACIVTLPPYQKKGYGTLLIAFSYELDRFELESRDENGLPNEENLYLGTPERPLSNLGAKGYLNFWTSVLVRFFRTLFPPPPPRIIDHQELNLNLNSNPSIMIEMTLEEISRSTRLRPDDAAFALISSGLTKFRKKSINQSNLLHSSTHPSQFNSSIHSNQQQHQHQQHQQQQDERGVNDLNNFVNGNDVIIITRDLVEQVAQRANVKSATLDPRHVLINSSNFDQQQYDQDYKFNSCHHSLSCSDSISDHSSPIN